MRKRILLLLILLISVTSQLVAQDQLPDLQRKLDGLFQLTKVTADHTDLVTAGSVLVLHREGLLMCSTQARIAIKNVYKGGRLAPSKAAWAFQMGMVQSELPVAQVPTRQFVPGEKFWVTGITADKSGVTLKVFSDPYDDQRYYGQIEIQFNKKSMPSNDEVLQSIAEVVTVDSGQESDNAAGGTAAPIPPPPPPGSAASSPRPAISAGAEDPLTTIRKRLDKLVVLTNIDLQTGEIKKAGSIIDLRKDGMLMWSLDTKVPPISSYKDGKLGMGFILGASVNAQLNQLQPGSNRFNVPSRKFVAGEKFWIYDYAVKDSGVTLSFVSDPYNDVRYYGQILFQFDKKQPTPAADAFMRTLAEVISVEGAPEEAAQPTPAAPAQQAPAPIAAPPPPPKVVSLGQTKKEVIAILGDPPKSATVGAKEIYYYPDMKVIFMNGKVSDVQ